MLDQFIGKEVVADLRSPFICLGKLHAFDDRFLDLRDADFHDLRDSDTSREQYAVRTHTSGIMANRRRTLLERSEVVAVSLLRDVLAG